jgi:hypothetical protein
MRQFSTGSVAQFAATSETESLIEGSFAAVVDQNALMSVDEVCKTFHIDADGCARVSLYLGKTLANLDSPLRIKHNVEEASPYFCVVTSHDRMHRSGFGEAGLFSTLLSRLPDAARSHVVAMDVSDESFRREYDIPTLVRVAPVAGAPNGNHVIVMYDRPRHMDPVHDLRQHDVPYEEKSDCLVWRGGANGPPHRLGSKKSYPEASRMLLVQKYARVGKREDGLCLDIGFSNTVGELSRYSENPTKWVKGYLTQDQLLKHKFLLIVEGNAEATQLEWTLASNSLPFMAEPRCQQWTLQSRLTAWKHYVPVASDFADLPEKVQWAINNPTAAKRIVLNGRDYMKEFANDAREKKDQCRCLGELLQPREDR